MPRINEYDSEGNHRFTADGLAETAQFAADLRYHYEFLLESNKRLSKPTDLSAIKADLDRWELMVAKGHYIRRPAE